VFVAGIDGCRGGWVRFKVDLASLKFGRTHILRNKPDDIAILAIDIPIGLLEVPRACDKAARKLLGQPRRRH
jgi:predicted RNase H-like nuclease